MDELQTALDKTLDELPRLYLSDLLGKKLLNQGINIPKRKRDQLAKKILEETLDSVNIDDFLPKKHDLNVQIEFTADDLKLAEEKFQKLVNEMPELIVEMTERTSLSILASLKQHWKAEARAQRCELKGFRERLWSRWGCGLESLQMMITISREFCGDMQRELNKNSIKDSRETLGVLLKLHARACQAADEILYLLCGGFADGAMARWRTLHEITSVAYLLQQHGDELTERYIQHQSVESYKAALQFQKYQKRLKQKPISDKVLLKLTSDYNSALDKYGKDFANSHGWAAKHLGKKQPTIADIQESAGIDHLAPYYRMASHNVHANPKGIFQRLGQIGQSSVLLAGPSNAGLADPGYLTARSLMQMSSTLLKFRPTLDNQVILRVMLLLSREIDEALFKTMQNLNAEHKSAGLNKVSSPRSI